MPAEARGHVRKLPSGKRQLRYYDSKGGHRSGGAFSSKTEAWSHYRDVIEPELHGRPVARRDVTLSELADTFLDRHGNVAQPAHHRDSPQPHEAPLDDFGDIPLVDLEQMTDEIAGFAASLPDRFRYSVMSAFRQTCAAGIRYGYMTTNPAKLAGTNPCPLRAPFASSRPRSSRRSCNEFDGRWAAAITFAAATGLRPSEWAASSAEISTEAGASSPCAARRPSVHSARSR